MAAETLLTDEQARDLAVSIVDYINGHTVEFSHDPARHREQYDGVARILRMRVQPCPDCARLRSDLADLRAREQKQHELLEAAARKIYAAEAQLARAREALRGMLLSADCEWENKRMGHDWPEACDAARAALAAPPDTCNCRGPHTGEPAPEPPAEPEPERCPHGVVSTNTRCCHACMRGEPAPAPPAAETKA